MKKRSTIIRRLKMFNSAEPHTVRFLVSYKRPAAYQEDYYGNHYISVERLYSNAFEDSEPIFALDGYADKAEYYICKMCDSMENYKQTDYIAVLPKIKVKGGRVKEYER